MNGSVVNAPYQLKSMNDLIQLPTPQFLIEDWLLQITIAMLVGDTGTFKSTLAIGICRLRPELTSVALIAHQSMQRRYL